jgi:hypothetical protein
VSATRIPFDPSLPFMVSAADLPYGPKRFSRGDTFPWRELGLSEYDLLQLWNANQVDAVVPVKVPMTIEGKSVMLTPGERVIVETPAQERKRRARS